MAGPPGTGKTSALRHMITSRGLHAAATYDEKVLASDAMFLDFVTSTHLNVLVIEDADNILTARSRGENALISRFLNFSDGLAKFRDKKIVFSTNMSDFGTIDPALTRLGRCFGALYARALTRDEAVRAARVAGVDLPPGSTDVTIAEIFNRQDIGRSIEPSRIGFQTKGVT
jgi:SpoVK/Ycf46/Vps4 family AAA+-type ATPase